MAVLESCPKHNMVAYLEKTDGNAEFHEIIDFLTRSSIHNALTWHPVSISEASIRSDLLFDDADGIDSLPNQAIFDVIQLMGSEEVMVPPTNTQSVSNNMVPNVNEASLSHNVFNERLEDAYFDASTTFHDPSNVHTFYQPCPHDKKWTKDHPLHKIIGDPKSSVRIRGQLANSCLFACLLSNIKPANVAEALKDVDWVSAMKDELD
ncbi:hypothetical protein Tco_0820634 [Tanacetum coccineum]|uniref:Uncharacterized protein n=1 Tax=Tanacetum coccineum TaxID=301880 RepID=A0ABQ5AA00_9ASTR